MKGLILKDLFALSGYAKQYVIALAFMVLWSVMMENASFIVMYLTLLGSMLVLTSITMDEAVSFSRFALTMPVSVKKLIGAKYMLLLITMGVGTAVSILFNLLIPLLKGGAVSRIEWEAYLVVPAVYLAINAFTLPAVFKMGAEKGRYAYLIVMMVFGFGIIGAIKIFNLPPSFFNKIEEMPGAVLGAVVGGASMALLAVSYLVSVKMVGKKEW